MFLIGLNNLSYFSLNISASIAKAFDNALLGCIYFMSLFPKIDQICKIWLLT